MRETEQKRGNLKIICRAELFLRMKFIVSVFNSSGELVSCCETDNNGVCCFNIEKDDTYKIRVRAKCGISPTVAYRWIFVNHHCNYAEFFEFQRIDCSPVKVKVAFSFTDANYHNLPINQGVITLWHNIMSP